MKITPEVEERHEETLKALKQDRIKSLTEDFQADAKNRGGFIAKANAMLQAKGVAGKLDINGLTPKGLTAMQWWEKQVTKDPEIIGLVAGREADGLDAKLVTAWLRDGNMTAFGQLAASNPILKLHAVARQHGKRDAFDRTSPYLPTQVRKEGEVQPNAGAVGRPENHADYRFFTRQSWNKSRQAAIFAADKKLFERLAAAAEVTIASTRPTK